MLDHAVIVLPYADRHALSSGTVANVSLFHANTFETDYSSNYIYLVGKINDKETVC